MNKIGNNKFSFGKYTVPGEHRGWFCGAFFEKGHPAKTKDLEIKYAEHKKGDIEKRHYHKKMIEVLILLKGKAKFTINNKSIILKGGDYLFVGEKNVISGKFLENTKLFAIHTPSLPSDEVIFN